MSTLVDPMVDCVFKAILGSEKHKGLLIHFLNAMLRLEDHHRVADVEVINPFNAKETMVDKYSVVDVKARDRQGRLFQLEIQMLNRLFLPERILYTWASMYGTSLASGDDYDALKPVISIWLLGARLFRESEEVHLPFGIYCPSLQRQLSDHCRIHLVQLKNWPQSAKITTERDRWVGFFRFGNAIGPDNLPDWMETDEMREAMAIKENFAEKGENHHLYLSRMDAVREARTVHNQLKRALAEKEHERLAKERAHREIEHERLAKERFRQMLEQAGIDPDATPE